ncbi:uncharacterized protein BJ212DRAFT_1346187 [Suillus subaureus]|uniref:F-box domain-containing protein n=1 Tax=Suillus subaureus TaxID=48587 RepID=A0A9P7EE49_9AGAM|nr:uncharacterized protein BJ212DRAFT_1346187 [Suillus subaureus]KAG1818550.1 hypothetical protein BJ212DRAFT_1346187 [Suillus subaureus]
MAERITMSSDDRIDAFGSFPAFVDTTDNIRQITGEGNDISSVVQPGSRHPVTSLSPFLPAEILALILQPRWKRCEDRKTWKKIVNVLLSCSLVSRAWCQAARVVLYQDIRLFRSNSLRLLLCTVRERFGGHCPTHTLQFMDRSMRQSKVHTTLAAEIVACCPELRYLAGEYGSLCFTSNMSLPEYPYLRGLKVSEQNLHLLAPLLSRLCNLESFEMFQGRDGDDLLEHFPPPRFKLSTLSISYTELSPGLCKWLESSSQSIECLVVEGISASLGHLAKVIGGFVKKVHVKTVGFYTINSDLETISSLSGFAGLRRLRVDGQMINKECLLNLQLSLETLTFSEDFASMRTVLALLRTNWQPSLQSLDVYRMTMSIYYSEEWIAATAEYRGELHSVCAARGLQLNWLSPEE